MALRRARRRFAYLPTESQADATVLLKPHGSINWFALLDRDLLSVDRTANVDVFGGDLNYYLLYLKDPVGPIDLGESSKFVKMALASLPAIVPPGATRLLSVGGLPRDDFVSDGHARAMRAIWAAFYKFVQSADELVVIGYSLPGTDAASIEMFRHWAGLRRRRRLFLVDPNRSLAERYRAVLNIPVQVIGRDFRKFDPRTVH